MQVKTLDDHDDPITDEVVETAVNDGAAAGADTGDDAPDETKAEDGPKSMLEAVMQSFKAPDEVGAEKDSKEDPPVSSANEDKSDTANAADKPASAAEAAAKEVGDPDYVPPEEWRQFGPKARKRIDRLRNSNRELTREADEARPYFETARTHDLSAEDVGIGFGLMALLKKGDFAGFEEGFAPIYAVVQEALGKRLPEDLQRQVDDGYATPEIASELARTRFKAEQASAQVETHRETAATQASTAVAELIGTTIADWEGQVRLRDPDYARKEGLIHKEAARLVKEHGVPRNQREALALARQAYDEATEVARSMMPATRKETRPTPTGSARPGTIRAEPRTMLEAVEQGIARA